ncbi:MAG TPA: hypothetical protein VJU81_08180 [Methylomirabilota bacterium]|nr:hypothetical protein [Methylomirabilota bacterium]
MIIVMTVLLGLMPIAVVVGLVWIAEWRRRRVETRVALQIRVTDAIHRELGAVAAPEVLSRAGGGWRVRMRVPAGRATLIAPLVRIAETVMQDATARPFEIVLLPPLPTPHSTRATRMVGPLAAAAR